MVNNNIEDKLNITHRTWSSAIPRTVVKTKGFDGKRSFPDVQELMNNKQLPHPEVCLT